MRSGLSEDLVGTASKFAFMATGSCPRVRKKFRESLPPSHGFVRFFPVLYRCGVALQSTRSPRRHRSPLYRCQRSSSRDWRHERVATTGSFSLITEAAPPPRRLACRYRATDLQCPNVSAQGPPGNSCSAYSGAEIPRMVTLLKRMVVPPIAPTLATRRHRSLCRLVALRA